MKWDLLRHAKFNVRSTAPISSFPKSFRILCDEIRSLKNELKKLKKKMYGKRKVRRPKEAS